MTYRNSMFVRAPRNEVWLVLSDVTSWPAWTESVKDVSFVTGTRLHVGAEISIKQPRMSRMTWRVDEHVNGSSFTWTARARAVTTTATHTIEDSPGGCRVTLTVEHDGPLAGLARLLFGKTTRRCLALEATGLEREVERRGPALVPVPRQRDVPVPDRVSGRVPRRRAPSA